MRSAHINFEGKAFPLTVLTPVTKRWQRILLRFVIWYFQYLRLADLAALRFIHFARWAIVKPEAFARESPRDDVDREYFLFSTNYNGPWDQYIDAFCLVENVRKGVGWLWKASDEFPGPWPIRRFKRFIRYHEIPVEAYYNAYPGATVRDIERALELRDRITEFERRYGPGDAPDDDELQEFINDTSNLIGGITGRLGPPNVTGQPRGLQL